MKFMNLDYEIMNFWSSNLSNKITIIMNFINPRRGGDAFAVRLLARTPHRRGKLATAASARDWFKPTQSRAATAARALPAAHCRR